MTNYRQVAPAIRWGTNYQNGLYLAYPLDVVTSWSAKREGSVDVQGPSGVEDSWTVGTDYLLKGDARWVPQSDTIGPPFATGWDGSLGWRAFLEWARDKNIFSLHPDGRNLLRAPWLNDPSYLGMSGYGLWATSVGAGVTGTASYDSANAAYKLTATASGGSSYIQIYQFIPAIPGEAMCVSADYFTSGLAAGAIAELFLNAQTSAPAFLSTVQNFTGLTATGWTRAGGGFYSSALPANTAYVAAVLQLTLPNSGSVGTVWFRNAMVRRDSTDATFLSNSGIDGYLLDPRMTRTAISLEPAAAQESDGTRRVTLMLRNASSAFDGY